jgi:hypothetical protein
MAKIKFYPFSQESKALAPEPTPASKNIPEWYKRQPAYGAPEEEQMLKRGGTGSTVKRCMPIFDIINSGYIIYVPCDIYIDATDPNKLKWSVPTTAGQLKRELVSSHAPEQVSHYPLNEKQYHKEIFRIMPFWSVGTEKGYSSLFTHPFHSDPVPFRAFGAIVDTDKFISDGHLSIQIEKDFKGVIERGTPLVQVIPFKRDKYSMELVDFEESNKILMAQRILIRSKFKNFYRNHLRVTKDYK